MNTALTTTQAINQRRGISSTGIAIGLLTALIMAIIIVGGWWFMEEEIHALKESRRQELATIGGLKVQQILTWREERLADAQLFSRGLVSTLLNDILFTPSFPEARADLGSWFKDYQALYHFTDAFVIATDGRYLASSGSTSAELAPETRQLVEQALVATGPVFGDLFLSPLDGQIHLEIAAAIFRPRFTPTGRDPAGKIIPPLVSSGPASETAPLGVLVLRENPLVFLYPLIQSWPTPSPSAETLLVRKEGIDALFLNTLRHRTERPLTIRVPLSNQQVPAVRAVLGASGVFEGLDYRGISVLSDLQPIRGTPWFMVAKVDAAEIFAEAGRFRRLALTLLLLLFLLTGAAAGLFYHSRRKTLFEHLYQSEREKRVVQEEIRATLYAIGDGVIATDAQSLVTRLNPVAETLTGWKEEEARGKPITEVFRIINEESRHIVENPVAKVMRHGLIVGLANHTLLVSRDGTERPIADSGGPIRDSDNQVSGAVLVFRDQTAERAAARALQQSEEQVRKKLTAILEPDTDLGELELGDVVDCQTIQLIMDEFFRLTRIGIGILDMQGKVLVGTGWQEICTRFHRVHPETLKHCKESDLTLTRGIEPGTFKLYKCRNHLWDMATPIMVGGKQLGNLFLGQFFLKDEVPDLEDFRARARQYGFDETKYLEALEKIPRWTKETADTVMAFYTKFMNLVSALSFGNFMLAKTLTARQLAEESLRKSEEQLRQAQKMESVGNLAGGVAHDFNNMLGVIIGRAELSLQKLEPNSPLQGDLTEILQSAHRSADLTRQLLAFARKQAATPRVIDLNTTVEGILKMLRRLIGEDIRLNWDPGPGLWPVKIDPAQVDQILANLCVNARDAISGVGTISLRTENVVFDEEYVQTHPGFALGDFVQLSVSDTGCGMGKEVVDRIFEPFFTTKEVGKGTGLGLAMVYGVVKQNEGFINVYSEPGQGSTFNLFFARTREPIPVENLNPAVQQPGGKETILLVEDEPGLLEIGQIMLQRLGYKVMVASAPDVALNLARSFDGPIHLLITDVIMPEMNGRELAEMARSFRPGMRVLFMSGYTADVIANRGVIEAGVSFLQKPFNKSRMAAMVRQVLDQQG